ncbi:hypothetical protein Tco_0675991, partial [Tanacetum coccineum]
MASKMRLELKRPLNGGPDRRLQERLKKVRGSLGKTDDHWFEGTQTFRSYSLEKRLLKFMETDIVLELDDSSPVVTKGEGESKAKASCGF